MVEYNFDTLERLAAHIHNLMETDGDRIYDENRRRNAPRVAAAFQGHGGEDIPAVVFQSGDSGVDELFYHLIDPKTILGTVRRGGREYRCNFIFEDICRNGLGPNQYERIAKEARSHILEVLQQQDHSGEEALTYLETHALDSHQRQRARRNWVDALQSYAHQERLTRDPAYVAYRERFTRGESIDVEGIRQQLPSSVNPDRLLSIAVRIMDRELTTAEVSGDFEDYFVRLDVLAVLDTIGTPEAKQKIQERQDDPKEADYIIEKASRLLQEVF